jgi:hypothetical protein
MLLLNYRMIIKDCSTCIIYILKCSLDEHFEKLIEFALTMPGNENDQNYAFRFNNNILIIRYPFYAC